MSVAQKSQRVLEIAQQMFLASTDWVTFYREILGVDGIVRRLFPTLQAMEAFEQTEEYQGIQRMLTELRAKGHVPSAKGESTRVITIRLPQSLHEALRIEAYERMTSMNKLCISKLLQFIDPDMVPVEMPEFAPWRSGRGVRRRRTAEVPRMSDTGIDEEAEEGDSEADL